MLMLPQPRALPKTVIWPIYSAIALGLLVAIAIAATTVRDSEQQQQQQTDDNVEERKSDESNSSTTAAAPPPVPELLSDTSDKEDHGTLNDVVNYEYIYKPGVDGVKWSDSRDGEISYVDESGKNATMNLAGYVDRSGKNATMNLADYVDQPEVAVEARIFELAREKDESSPRKERALHVATLWNCYVDETGDEACRFNVKVFSSSIVNRTSSVSKSGIAATASSQDDRGEAPSSEYSYVHRERDVADEASGKFGHKFSYKVRLLKRDVDDDGDRALSNATVVVACSEQLLAEYDFRWSTSWFQPKYTFTNTETCATRQQSWKDEFAFDRIPLNLATLHLTNVLPSRAAAKSDATRKRRGTMRRAEKRAINHPTSSIVPKFRTSLNNDDDSPQHQRTSQGGNSSFDYYHEQQRRRPSTRWNSTRVSRTRESIESTLLDLIATSPPRHKRSSTNVDADIIKIGSTPWHVHKVVHKPSTNVHSTMSLAVSRYDADPSEFLVPRTNDALMPLLNGSLYVTRLLRVKVTGEDEALAYFVAAPVRNVSVRHFYRIKVIYPPLEFHTYEQVHCLTCPDLSNSSAVKPSCSYADVDMSASMDYYILRCKGPKVPSVSLVSTSLNVVVEPALDTHLHEMYAHYSARPQLTKHDFQVELANDHSAWVRLHLPPASSCRANRTYGERPMLRRRLLLRVADEQDGQMVTAEYSFDLTSYLVNVAGYAVVHADVRGSYFHRLDLEDLTYREIEAMQLADYARVVERVASEFRECVDDSRGFAVLGERYGGHLALNLLTDNKRAKSEFRCGVAVTPFADYNDYYAVSLEHELPSATFDQRSHQLFACDVVSPLASSLHGKHFAMYVVSADTNKSVNDNDQRRQRYHYTQSLIKLLNAYGVEFDELALKSEERFAIRYELYAGMVKYLKECFGR